MFGIGVAAAHSSDDASGGSVCVAGGGFCSGAGENNTSFHIGVDRCAVR